MEAKIKQLKDLLKSLTGRKPQELVKSDLQKLNMIPSDTNSISYSQFNEILLIFGYNRISESLFQFIVNCGLDYDTDAQLTSMAQLRQGVDNFRKIALLFFGSINNAYTELSRKSDKLRFYVNSTLNIDEDIFRNREAPVMLPFPIDREKTPLLGYLAKEKILDEAEDEKKKKEIESEITVVKEKGEKNHEAYLVSDYLDIYIATSMRLEHEFMFVNRITKELFEKDILEGLKLRWFDPTQAYCENRIDKGLSEALMLKRASCTIYFAQESDSLGKDSELATTLAQGKPVIAFVPEGDKKYLDNMVKDIRTLYPQKTDNEILFKILRIIEPDYLWENQEISGISLVKKPFEIQKINNEELFNLVVNKLSIHYNNRYTNLKLKHPLGIQVNLATGVANGLLVVRNIDECARLLKAILLRNLTFKIVDKDNDYIELQEDITGCVYRIVTGDKLLTNSFWNFYLNSN